jgi:hypothetical protein
VSHAQLVLDDEQAVEERLGLQQQGVVDVLLGGGWRRSIGQRVAEEIGGLGVSELAPRVFTEKRRDLLGGDEAIPVVQVYLDIVIKVVVGDRAVVPPRVAGEEVVAARPGECTFHELAGQQDSV